MSVDEYRAHARKWADLCLAYYGVTPIIYSSLEFYRAYLKGKFDNRPFWVGDVDAARSYVDGEPWTFWHFRHGPFLSSLFSSAKYERIGSSARSFPG